VIRIARAHQALGTMVKWRARPVVVGSYPEAREGPEGQVLVGVYEYDRARTLPAAVDPKGERVLSLDEAPGTVPVKYEGDTSGPFTNELQSSDAHFFVSDRSGEQTAHHCLDLHHVLCHGLAHQPEGSGRWRRPRPG
jgi:hypothetical protein